MDDIFDVDWFCTTIPATIRRPWELFVESLEDRLADAVDSQGCGANDSSTRASIADAMARGARVAFLELPVVEQRSFEDVSLMELAAFVRWSVHAERSAGQPVDPMALEAAWGDLDYDEKVVWVPEDPREVLGMRASRR